MVEVEKQIETKALTLPTHKRVNNDDLIILLFLLL